MKPNEQQKLNKIRELIFEIPKLNILELGVQSGNSTKMFIDICEKNDGYLTSVDIDDCSNVIKNPRWTFIHSSDDNFVYVDKFLKNNFDVLFIDSLHEPNHVKKVFYHYFKFLNNNALIIIDDVIWLPYVKGSEQDNDFVERINRLTFDKVLEIYNSNIKNLTLNIEFLGSGMAILKKKNNQLNEEKKIKNRLFTIKNIIKNIYTPKPKK
tara:strand:- start:320 stop:949 length:630 start_codon:yes stop_codon:yes gene_type:complete